MTSAAPPEAQDSRRVRDLIAVNFGNTLEWYDWTIYTIFAHNFAVQFFNSNNAASALLSTLAVFIIGFIARPIGGILFGAYADWVGRRKSLFLAMILTASGSLVIAIAPTYASLSAVSSLILVFARIIQELAHGGEMGTSVTYLVERTPMHKRALYGSSSWVSVVLGTIIATLIGLLLNSMLDDATLNAWGLRVAFALGGVLGLYALYLRQNLTETEVVQEKKLV